MGTKGRYGVASGIAIAILLAALVLVVWPRGEGDMSAPSRVSVRRADASQEEAAHRGEKSTVAAAPADSAENERPAQKAGEPAGEEPADHAEADGLTLNVDDLWRLSDEELRDARRAFWRYRYAGPEFRTTEPEVSDDYLQRLTAAVPEEDRKRDGVLLNFHSALSDVRRRDGVLRDACLEGTFLKVAFGGGHYYGTNRDEVLPSWRRNLEALGMEFSPEEMTGVGEVLLDTYANVDALQQRYREKSGASEAWDPVRSNHLDVLAYDLLERDLVEYYYDWESSLRDALTEENFAVAEKLFRSLGLQGGQPVAGE